MERAAAIKQLGKILGKNFGYRIDEKAPRKDGRDAAADRLREERPRRDALRKQMEERRAEILAADQEYQRLKTAYMESNAACDQLQSTALRYRITVGTTNSLFFHVKAQGDSWESVIAELKGKRS